MSFWPPPPPLPPASSSSAGGSSSPPHSQTHALSSQELQQRLEDVAHRFHYEQRQSETHAYPIYPYDHSQQQQQQGHEHGDVFAWQHQQQRHHHQHHLPIMNIDPLPILHSSGAELQRASVSIEDEIFEARMLQEALQDCETTGNALASHQHQHHNQSPVFQSHSFQTQLMYSPSSHFATVTPTNNSTMLRGSLAQRDPSIQVVSPVENLRSYMMGHPLQLNATSPSSYSSSSSNRSPAMGLASLQGSTPPASASSSATTMGQAQPKKRVQTARICHIEGCTRGIRSRGLCKAHGGGRRCTTPGCTTSDQGGGHCVLHGGGRRCRVDGCMKSAQWRGVCKLHGGARRCRYGHCAKNGQVKQGYCRLHYNLLTQQRLQGLLSSTNQDESSSSQGGERKQEEQEEDEEKPFVTDASQHQQRP